MGTRTRAISYSEITAAFTCLAKWDYGYGGLLTGGHVLHRREVARNLSDGRAAVASWHASDGQDANSLFGPAHPSQCILACDHAPAYGSPSSEHPSNEWPSSYLDVLKAHGVDLMLNGHQHFYERISTPIGATELTVGTGGIGHYQRTSTASGSQAYSDTAFGAVKITLNDNGWSSLFVPNQGSSFSDTASGGCGP